MSFARSMPCWSGKVVTWAVMLTVWVCTSFAGENRAMSSARKAPLWSVHTSPSDLVNGSPVLMRVTAPTRLKSLSGSWLGHEIVFEQDGGSWLALAGVSLETRPGSYPLLLTGATASGSPVSFRRSFAVGRAKYPLVQLTVSRQFTEPSAEQQAQIKQDQEVKQKAFSGTSPQREWSGRFSPPVTAPVSDVFGTRRVFNGATKSVHQGLDYRVPPQTPVAAVNAGTVVLAQPLYFEGNCVVLDHGQGLLTLYLHLAELKVKQGERVERGQVIGFSGATGRATGPHLHVAVRWQGTYLNPAVLLALPLPELAAKTSRAPE